MRRPLGVAMTVLAALATGACSGEVDRPSAVAEIPTTTGVDQAADMVAPAEPLPVADVIAGLDAAARSGDVCQVLDALDVAVPSEEPAEATAVYRALAEAAAQAAEIVPAEIAEAWGVLVVGTEDAAVALEQRDGNLADPEVEAALASTAMVRAIERIERFRFDSCPAPVPPPGS